MNTATEGWKQKFYKSKPWRELRMSVIRNEGRNEYICQHCGEIIIGSPSIHHKIELTEANYTDPEISLNPELLEILCHDCHDVKHGRFAGRTKDTIVDYALNIDYKRR